MKYIKQDSLDSRAESHTGRRVVHSNDMPVIIAVVLKTQPEGDVLTLFDWMIILQTFAKLQSELNVMLRVAEMTNWSSFLLCQFLLVCNTNMLPLTEW